MALSSAPALQGPPIPGSTFQLINGGRSVLCTEEKNRRTIEMSVKVFDFMQKRRTLDIEPIKTLQTQCSDLLEQVSNLSKQLAEKSEQEAKLKEAIASRDQTIQELTARNVSLAEEVRRLTEALDKSQKEKALAVGLSNLSSRDAEQWRAEVDRLNGIIRDDPIRQQAQLFQVFQPMRSWPG